MPSIYRNASRAKPFTPILNAALQDDRLSPEAGWLLMLVLSLPTDWHVRLDWLAQKRRLGRDRTRAAVRELHDFGYCERRQTRKADGTLGGYEFAFTDQPGVFGEPAPDLQAPVAPQPAPEQPAPVNPSPTKQSVQQNNKRQKKKERAELHIEPSVGTDPPAEPDGEHRIGTDDVRAIEALGGNVDELYARAKQQETKTGRIREMGAYLVQMRKNDLAAEHGVPIEAAQALITGNRRERARATGKVLGVRATNPVRTELLRRAGATESDGAALLAALNGRGR